MSNDIDVGVAKCLVLLPDKNFCWAVFNFSFVLFHHYSPFTTSRPFSLRIFIQCPIDGFQCFEFVRTGDRARLLEAERLTISMEVSEY